MLPTEFLGGVVEGFYGRPWTTAQRLDLLGQLSACELNTYFYAPKDDLKHRAIWRQPYVASEVASLQDLIDECRRLGIHFIYGLSPGLDIQFSSPSDRDALKGRLAQLLQMGCTHFALLFDDLPGQLSDSDRQAYASVAEGQCSVTGEILGWLRSHSPRGRFLFCPTPYCDRMDRWKLAGEGYFETLGAMLDPSIDVLWTGPEIVSREISVDSIQRLTQRIRRKPIIWDNLHANDYDGRRLYVGPYAGRPVELRRHIGGILANPNNEYPINFPSLHTLAAYLHADATWAPREAYLQALREWLPRYTTVGEPFTMEELILLGDCYYLPYDSGPSANELCEAAAHLVQHPVEKWGDAEVRFAKSCGQVQRIFDKLTQLHDRELFYAWSRRVWDLKEELQLLEGFIARKKAAATTTPIETHLAGTYRGGIVARLQLLLTMDPAGRFRAAERDDHRGTEGTELR